MVFKNLILILLIYILFISNVKSNNIISLPSNFDIIGPFPIGEREQGLDTLQAYGGIFNIPRADKTLYPSELGNASLVGWVNAPSTTSASGGVTLSLDWMTIVNWSFLQQIWGWNIWLWYAYAVGDFNVPTTGTYVVTCTGTTLVYYIQSSSNKNLIYEFSSDFYAYGTGQQIIDLNSGAYKLYVRMQSSTRLTQSPVGFFTCTMSQTQTDILVLPTETLVSDVVGGNLASPFAAITVINSGNQVLTNVSLKVSDSYNHLVQSKFIRNSASGASQLDLLPGQKFVLQVELNIVTEYKCPLYIELDIMSQDNFVAATNLTMNCTQWGEPFLFTFLDFDGSVQYAMAAPPTSPCGLNSQKCGLIVATHGAGVEASTWLNALPLQETLWIIYPTGRRSWGYDWMSSSRLNIFYGIDYLANNLPGVPSNLKSSYQLDSNRILAIGHSMGSFGCWSLMAHYGDLVIGGACASGFVKLQHYIFYNTDPGLAFVDPVIQGLLMASIAEHDLDLYSTNLVGLPLMTRYGENDTNVNPWHSRRMARMICELSQNETAVGISAVPNQGHWFNGILSDSFMLNYYDSLVNQYEIYHPPIPKTITVTTNNPASSGSRANILILQTIVTARVARIQVTQMYENNELVWIVNTQNVRRFGFTPTPVREAGLPVKIILDNQVFSTVFLPDQHFCRLDKWLPDWNATTDTTWPTYERSPATYGPMRAIFEKPFTIIYGTNTTTASTASLLKWGAVYIANFFNTYGRGSPEIIADVDFIPTGSCNANQNYILLGNTYQNFVANKFESQLPVIFNSDNSFSIGPVQAYNQNGVGISYIAPNQCGQGLILNVAGVDDSGFNNALHAIPQRSGVVAPDFMVVGNEWGWKGAGGIISTGFWDPSWNLAIESSYFSLQT
ncbi:hypothetical protein CYY_007318 [Polysphondylium violaceum]|uniref:Peptidase S9 prolyl oligopeptidase catalytic domain-containing protein n=1 Tax=Polysphondylium violaceum TaxID=133409 RepID=A0A8J4PS17_9MYCE|nr:hypothetical protein CYY_007318 [Polysphondylium violaceum]